MIFPSNILPCDGPAAARRAAGLPSHPIDSPTDIVRNYVAILMNFLYKDNKYCINCDWLQYSVYLDSINPKINCPNGFRVELCQGNNIYKSRALVFDKNGRKVLTMLWEPYSSILDPHVMTVQVGNEGLYTGFIQTSLDLTKQITKCYFNSIGRFDLCCDFLMTPKRLEMVKHLQSGHYYVERKNEGSNFWHKVKQNDFNKHQTHCISFGSKHSEIKVKIYNKSREIGLIGGGEPEKPWIVQQWEEIGLDKLSVWRLEFSLTSNGQLRWQEQPILLENVASPSWIMRVFFDLYFSRFVCRVNQGKKKGHHNEDKRVFLIDLPADGEKLTWKEPDTSKTDAPPAVTLLRSLMRNFENEALLADKSLTETYCNTLIDVINTHGLGDYFERTFQKNPYQFAAEIIDQAGPTITNQIASVTKLMD